MRHRRRGRVLGRSPSHRKALLRNLASSLFLTERDDLYYEGLFQSDGKTPIKPPKHKGRIVTTLHKAKEVRPLVEKCITIARKTLKDQQAADKLLPDVDSYELVLATTDYFRKNGFGHAVLGCDLLVDSLAENLTEFVQVRRVNSQPGGRLVAAEGLQFF